MDPSLVARLALPAALVSLSGGCSWLTFEGTRLPAAIARWHHVCLVDGAALSPRTGPGVDPSGSEPAEIVPGGRAVLFAEARYGESLLRSEYSFVEIQIELDPPSPGGIVSLDPSRAQWIEGGQAGSTAWPMRGSATFEAVHPDSVTLGLSLQSAGGSAPSYTESVPVRRVPTLADCFR